MSALRQLLIRSVAQLGGVPVPVDPYGLDKALADRKANRAVYSAVQKRGRA